MPHEVIMPALGMAQDTGHLVAWRKEAGDKVSAGDVLMEIETDKSTVEVEAGADGWLTELRASAGDDVPVGRIVAVIGETPEASAPAPMPAPPKSETAAAVDGVSVIMPALGMAQDTGLIVSWTKAPGDPIAAGEVLLEVETDKSTMEIEAQSAGFVAEIRAAAGANVPVGEVIAVISVEKPAAPTGPGEAPAAVAAPAEKTEKPAPASKPEPAPAPAPVPSPLPAPVDGRVLASPKARRLAAERGLDLAALFAEGAGQPIHVRDLDALAAKVAERRTTAPAAASAPAAPAARLEARAPAAPMRDFTAWLASERGDENRRAAVLAAFAGAGLRGAHDGQGALVVAVETAGGADPARYADADRARLASLAPSPDAPAPALVVRDLLGTRLVSARAGGLATPVLTLVPAGDEIALSLDYAAGALDDRAAIALVTALADRLAEPLRHLL